MRKLKSNEEFVKDEDGNIKRYNNRFILIRVKCPNEQSYITTMDLWTSKNIAKVPNSNQSSYKSLGFMRGGISL